MLSRSYSTNKATPFNGIYPGGGDLKKRILKVVSSGVREVLENWVDEGRRVSLNELRVIIRQLVKRRRFGPALEVLSILISFSLFLIKPSCSRILSLGACESFLYSKCFLFDLFYVGKYICRIQNFI